jgi:hypothetical protein
MKGISLHLWQARNGEPVPVNLVMGDGAEIPPVEYGYIPLVSSSVAFEKASFPVRFFYPI